MTNYYDEEELTLEELENIQSELADNLNDDLWLSEHVWGEPL